MSFDDGSPQVDFDSVKALIRTVCEDRKWTFEQLCAQAGLSPHQLARAMERGTEGFPESFEVFQRLSMALGVPIDAVLNGELRIGSSDQSAWLRVKKLLWEFVYKMNIDHLVGQRFERFMREFMQVPHAAGNMRLRKGSPQNFKDMAKFYERFKSGTSN